LNFDERMSRPYSQKHSTKNSLLQNQTLSLRASHFNKNSNLDQRINLDKLEEEDRNSYYSKDGVLVYTTKQIQRKIIKEKEIN
jgi:hypothetical protein